MSCSSAARRAVLARRAELVGHHRGQVGALDGVREHVLAVARAVLQAAEDLDQLRVQAADVGLEGRLLAGLDDVGLELGLGLVVGLLDPGRVDAAVLQELLERHARDLAADAVEAGEDHGVRRVVDDEVDAGEVLERADVAALAADDAALHVVGGELDDGHGGLGGVAGGQPLHHDGEDVAHAAVGVALGLLLDLAQELGRVVADLVLELLEQLVLGLRGRHPRRPLELAHVPIALRRRPPARGWRAPARGARAAATRVLERLLAADEPLLLTPDLRAAGERVVVAARRRLAATGFAAGAGGERDSRRRPARAWRAAVRRPPGRRRAPRPRRPPRSRFPFPFPLPRLATRR